MTIAQDAVNSGKAISAASANGLTATVSVEIGRFAGWPCRVSSGRVIDSEGSVAECESYFKVKPGTGLKGADIPCHCPYCGHEGSPQTFWTKEQIEYAKSVAIRRAAEAITKDLKQLERTTCR